MSFQLEFPMTFRPALLLSCAAFLSGAFSMGAVAQDAAAAAPITFASGANSISETHGDWTLICGVQAAAKVCVITQTLGDERSGQRVVTLEFEAAGEGTEGTLMMPFGLRLSDGVRTQIGGVTVGEPAAFATCYDRGCLASFSMDAEVTALLKRGQELNLIAIADDSGESVVVKASLIGFSSALARSVELVQ
jgi:invasion protein IalB